MKKSFVDQIHSVVSKAVEKYGTVYRLAQVTGINKVNIGRWVNGTAPRTADVAPIIELMGAELVLPDEQALEYDYVPKHAAKAGAGASLETSDDVEGLYAFRKDWMASMGIHASRAVMLDVVGDSMEPLLHEGDTLLIDKGDTEIREGKIYVVTLGDELRVKRIYKALNGVILRSENPRYPDVTVSGTDLEALIVHGRVKWCGKML